MKGPEGVPWVRVLEEDPQQGRWPGEEAWVTEPAAEDPWGRPHSLGLDLVQTSLQMTKKGNKYRFPSLIFKINSYSDFYSSIIFSQRSSLNLIHLYLINLHLNLFLKINSIITALVFESSKRNIETYHTLDMQV